MRAYIAYIVITLMLICSINVANQTPLSSVIKKQRVNHKNKRIKALNNNSKSITTIPSILSKKLEIAPNNDNIQASKTLTGILSIFIPWLYFLAISLNIPNMPKYVNWSVNKGNINVTPNSQKIYGDYSGLDSFCTFLSVNLIGCLSDIFGRKPFITFSIAGLGLSYIISAFAYLNANLFYVAGCIDGLTSSMFAQAQGKLTYSYNNTYICYTLLNTYISCLT